MPKKEFQSIVLIAPEAITDGRPGSSNPFELMHHLRSHFRGLVKGNSSQVSRDGKFVLQFHADPSITADDVTRALTAKTSGGHFTFREADPESFSDQALSHLSRDKKRRIFTAPCADYPVSQDWFGRTPR